MRHVAASEGEGRQMKLIEQHANCITPAKNTQNLTFFIPFWIYSIKCVVTIRRNPVLFPSMRQYEWLEPPCFR